MKPEKKKGSEETVACLFALCEFMLFQKSGLALYLFQKRMLHFKRTDFVAMDGYPFAWRWKRENVDSSLSGIKPLTESKAAELYEYSKRFQGRDYHDLFDEQAFLDLEVSGLGNKEVADWLEKTFPESNDQLIISWTQRQAVLTDLQTFVVNWFSFCMPVEDVVIWPENEQWVMLFDYKQRFYFAVKR